MEGSLSPAALTKVNGQVGKTKLFSCTLCQQRKVKCDKVQPTCSNCIKRRAKCIYVAPALPIRKKRKCPEEDVLDRLKRYERLLQAHSIPADDNLDHGGTPTKNNTTLETSKRPILTERLSPPRDQNGDNHGLPRSSGEFVANDGKRSFIESPLWNILSDELQGPVDMRRLAHSNGRDNPQLSNAAPYEDVISAGDFLLNTMTTHSATELKTLHPNPLIIFRLWQIFLDNINPLTKLIHAPTTQQRLLDASADIQNVSKEWEALMFAIYLSAIQSMSVDECQSIMGESKRTLVRTYHPAVRSALIRANFTSSMDILLVQAFALYLLSVRQYHEPNTLWVLTGTAVRLGQRIGLHRDGTLVGLSPFETEIRRRVWWRLLALDGQTAELCGAGLSNAFPRYDCKRPLNVNDSDLSPDMSALPPEHDGPTEMIFCGFRFEIGLFLRNVKASCNWTESGISERAVEEKKKQLDELQALIEHKYLRFCDPSLPLHLFARLMGQATIMALRLVAPYPRRYPQGLIEMSPQDRDEVFWISMHVLGIYNLSQRTESIRRFLWNVNVQFQWHAFIILAHELQLRPDDQHTRDAWSKIEELFEYNSDVIVNTASPLHKAVSRLILKAWSVRQHQFRRSNTPLSTPSFVARLLLLQTQTRTRIQAPPLALLPPPPRHNQSSSRSTAHETTRIMTSNPTSSETATSVPGVPHSPPSAATTESTSTDITTNTNTTDNPNITNNLSGTGTGTNDDAFLDSLTPSMVFATDGAVVPPIDWSEWDYLLQDFELQNASFAQT